MKSLLLLPLLLCSILFTGCKKEYYDVVVTNRTINFTVQPSAWQANNSSNSYIATLNIPELDNRVNQSNGVLVYISGDGQTFEAIPDVFAGSTFVYSYTIGKLFLEVQDANGTQISPPSSDIFVKVVLVESDVIP
jgi:hypothetical protein